MRYVLARLVAHRRDTAYRIYVTDCLKMLTRNTACNGGSYVTVRFAEALSGGKRKKELAEGEATEKIRNKLR